jgi:hypothetical protein
VGASTTKPHTWESERRRVFAPQKTVASFAHMRIGSGWGKGDEVLQQEARVVTNDLTNCKERLGGTSRDEETSRKSRVKRN